MHKPTCGVFTLTPIVAAQGLALAIFLLICATAEAKNIYKFQDEKGVWHFTDQVPEESQDFDTVYMEREPEPRVHMRMEGPDSSPVYILFNDFWGPVEVELSLVDQINVLAEPALPARFVVPGQTEKMLVGMGALDPGKGFQYRLQLESVPGKPMPDLVQGLVIDPPFPAGSSFYVSQGFNGTETHNTPDSTYAIDIVMPIGTTVVAARDGVIMDVEEDFNRSGSDLQEFADKANHVRILHDDGTMALYAHLDLASVEVQAGRRIRAGQPIARSGNTGFSTGPHLHFVIQQNVGMQMQSAPFRLNQPEGRIIVPDGPQLISGTLPGS
jgi:hypothetical protein